MYIMIFHPDNANYTRFKLNRLDDEVAAMVEARLRAVRAGGGKIVKFDEVGASDGIYGFVD
jgi:hypothetical protein